MTQNILFMGGDTHEVSLVPVEIDNSPFALELAAQGITRFRSIGDAGRIAGGVENLLGYPVFESSNKLEFGSAYGFVRELSGDEANQLQAASDAFVADRNAKRAAQPPPSLIAQGLACVSCGAPRRSTRGYCPRCGA